MAGFTLRSLPADWEHTRTTLHAYSKIAGVVARAHAPERPNWWHLSLEVTTRGLVTDQIPLPDGGALDLALDLEAHRLVVSATGNRGAAFSMGEGLSADDMAQQVFAQIDALGLEHDYAPDKYSSPEERAYDPEHAAAFWDLLVAVNGLFARHRATLPGGSAGPIQLWPHGFDLSVEWFGSRIAEYEELGEVIRARSQVNLGFYPGDTPYFYSNPWPFDEKLVGRPLPEGASWHTEGWQGTELPLSAVADREDGPDRILEFAAAVFALVRPTIE